MASKLWGQIWASDCLSDEQNQARWQSRLCPVFAGGDNYAKYVFESDQSGSMDSDFGADNGGGDFPVRTGSLGLHIYIDVNLGVCGSAPTGSLQVSNGPFHWMVFEADQGLGRIAFVGAITDHIQSEIKLF